MMLPSLPWSRALRSTLFAGVVPGLAFVVLAGLGVIAPGPALLGFAGTLAGLFAVYLVRLADLVRLARHIERLSRGEAGERPRFVVSATARDIAAAIGRLERGLSERIAAAEGARREIEQVLDRLPDPLILLDRRRIIRRANEAAKDLMGRGIEGHEIATALRNPMVLEALDAALREGKAQTVELFLIHPIERTFEVTIEPRAAGEDGDSVLLLMHDITAVKRSEQMRADFVANASHEIRTPLSSLIGFIETLQGPARDDAEARGRFLEMMESQAVRMARLVDDLLSLSRIEIEEHRPPTGTAALPDLLKAVCSTLEWQAKASGVAIALDLAPDLPPVIGEEAELNQVFHNLVINAIKYGRQDGTVRIEGRRCPPPPGAVWRRAPAEAVAVAVIDQGEGIPKEHIPRLTERFYRVDSARSRQMGGTGLGLAIVKHIVNRHRGALTIESTLGVGSRFTVYLRPAPALAATRTAENAA